MDIKYDTHSIIVGLFVKEGGHVAADQTVATMDLSLLEPALAQARQTLQKDQASLLLAQASLRRSEALAESQVLPQAWAPLTDDMAFPQNRRAHLFTTLAREKAGISREAVNADLQAIAAQVQQENHDVDPEFTFRAERLQDNLVSSVRPTLLMGAVAFVL